MKNISVVSSLYDKNGEDFEKKMEEVKEFLKNSNGYLIVSYNISDDPDCGYNYDFMMHRLSPEVCSYMASYVLYKNISEEK